MGPQKGILVGKMLLVDDITPFSVIISLESFSLLHTRYGVIKINMYRIARKFGGELNLAVCVKTAKLKSAKFFYVCMYVWQYRTIPPNLSPL